jgi:hypothetical protein
VAQRERSEKKRVGISHYPVEEENQKQEAVPPRGEARQRGARRASAPRKRAKSVAEAEQEGIRRGSGRGSDGPAGSKGGKGGRSGGSRAGLLSSGHTDRGRKGRKPHPLDLL